MATKRQAERARAIAHLREILRPGDTVTAVVRSVSRSGMTRMMDFYKATADGMVYLSPYFATVLGIGRDKRGSCRVTGCGMDMAFWATYNAGRCLFPEGFKVDGRGRNGDTSGWDKDGGYALKSTVL